MMMGSGIISAAILGAYIEKTLKYTKVFRVLVFLTMVQCVGFPLIIRLFDHSFGLALVLTFIMGIVLIPFMPLTFDYGSDILFPAG